MTCKNSSLNKNIQIYGHGIFTIPYACALNNKKFFIPASPHIQQEYDFKVDAMIKEIDLNISQDILTHVKMLELEKKNNNKNLNLYRKILSLTSQEQVEDLAESSTNTAIWCLLIAAVMAGVAGGLLVIWKAKRLSNSSQAVVPAQARMDHVSSKSEG